jgi:hypothetical protein
MFVQYCQCIGVDNFEKVREIIISNGALRRTVLYCCEQCYQKYFAQAK